MLATENNNYSIGGFIVAAFGYEGMNRRKTFQKVSDTHYRLPKRAKLVSYRSLHTLEKAMQNESV
ncbi:MAG: hypothetical protein ACRCVX_16015 [Shewanella sp.]